MKDTIVGIVVTSLSLIAILGFGIWTHYYVAAPNAIEVDYTVESKNSKKGLFIYPRYEVYVNEKFEPSFVSKDTFYSLEEEDTITGYLISDMKFVTEDHLRTLRMFGYPFAFSMYILVFLWVFGAIFEIPFFAERKKGKRLRRRIFKIAQMTGLIAWLLVGFIIVALVTMNLYHKMNKFQLVETEATVVDKAWENRGGGRYRFHIYELMLTYADENGDEHTTKKAVTKNTFNEYSLNHTVPITYRKNNVDDTFVQANSFNEVWQVFLNVMNIYLLIFFTTVGVLVYSIIDDLRRKNMSEAEWNKYLKEEEWIQYLEEREAREKENEDPPSK